MSQCSTVLSAHCLCRTNVHLKDKCDAGEEPDVGNAQDNYLAFAARQDTAAGSGALVVYWPNTPGGNPGCSSNTSWPILDAVTVLGIPAADPASVTVMVCIPYPAAGHDRLMLSQLADSATEG